MTLRSARHKFVSGTDDRSAQSATFPRAPSTGGSSREPHNKVLDSRAFCCSVVAAVLDHLQMVQDEIAHTGIPDDPALQR